MALQSRASQLTKKPRDEDSPTYWRQYGLTRNPFTSHPDNSLTFLFGKWEHHLDLIQHLIHTENVLLAVFGAKGSGKTTLIQQLVLQINDIMDVHCVNGGSKIDLNQLIVILQEGFKLPKNDTELLEEKLDNQITDLQYRDRICVLLIDNAEKLPEETLQALIYLIRQQSKTQMRLHIVLFGDNELQTKLAKLARQELSGDMIHSIELEPLTLEETRQYLQHRLQSAGLKTSLPFTPLVIDEIYQASGGVPEQINMAAERTMINKMMEFNMPSKNNFIAQHQTKILGGALIIAVLAALVFFLDKEAAQNNSAHIAKPIIAFSNNPTEKPVKTVVVASNTTANNNGADNSAATANQTSPAQPYYQINTPPEAPTAQTSDMASNGSMAANVNDAQASVPMGNNNAAATAPTNAPANNTVAANSNANPNSAATAVAANNATPVNSAANSQSQAAGNNASQAAAIANYAANTPANTNSNKNPKAKANPAIANVANNAAPAANNNAPSLAAAEQNVLTPNQPAASNNNNAVSSTPAKKVASAVETKPSTRFPVTAANTRDLSAANSHILALPAQHYTLQVLALSHESAMKDYIAANGLAGNAHYFTVVRNGKTMYVLVVGDYSSQAAAKAAVASLPAAVQKNAIWPRSFAAVQNEIRSSNG